MIAIDIVVTTLDSVTSIKTSSIQTTWSDFATIFCERSHALIDLKNKGMTLFNLTEFENDGRKKSEAVSLCGVVIDWDGDIPIDEIERSLQGFEYIMFTSYRHREDGQVDKVKTILPFNDKCDIDEWEKRRVGAAQIFLGCDSSSLRATQFQTMPNCPANREDDAFIRHIEGEFFNWRSIPANTLENCSEREFDGSNPSDIAHLLSSKTSIDPDAIVHHKNGYIRAGDISGSLSDIFCPNHTDNNPSEFANVNDDGIPYIVCSTCGTLWIRDATQIDPVFSEFDITSKVDRGLPVQKPLSWDDTCEKLQEAIFDLTNTNVLFGPEGSGKSYIANLLCEQGKTILFACRSNKQAEEKYSSLSKFGLSIKMLSSRSYEIEKKYHVKPVRYPKVHPWDEGKINEQATFDRIVAKNPEMVDSSMAEILGDSIDNTISWQSTDIVITTHARVGHLGRSNIRADKKNQALAVPDDVIIFFDDPDTDDFMTLATFPAQLRKQSVYGQQIEIFYPKNGNDVYYVKPSAVRPGYGFNEHQVIFTTTESVILALIQQNYPEITIHDKLMPAGYKIAGGNVHLISTKLVRSAIDGILPPIMERVRRFGFDFEYIANGQGSEVNLVNNKGMNRFSKSNIVVEISVPTKTEITTLFEQFDRQVSQKKLKFLVMLDRIQQTVGRNSGYRWQGKECVVLINPLFFTLALEYSRYSFESAIKADRENIKLFPLKQPEFDSIHSSVAWLVNRYKPYIRSGNAFKFDCQKCLQSTPDNHRETRLQRLLVAIDTLKSKIPDSSAKLESIKSVILDVRK